MENRCTSAVLNLNIKDVLDYCWCPKYYELKNKNPDEYNLKEAYDVALHKCFYSYLISLQQDTLKNSIEFLKYRWGKEWIKQKTNSQLICTPSAAKRDTYDTKRRNGIDAIITFDKIMNTPQCPIIINKDYAIKITDDIILHGTWEYIREIDVNDQKVFQIMKFRTENNRFQVSSQMRHDLELTAAALAFKHTFNPANFELIYVDIYKKKMVASIRKAKDYELLKETIISVAQCMRNNIKCVSPDKRCFHCEYRDVCTSSM